MDAFFVAIAALAGILIGFWLRGSDRRAEIGSLDQRNRDMSAEVARLRLELEKAGNDTAARAAFESLAAEREKSIAQMSAELEKLRFELQVKAEADKAHAARVGELEADLRNERDKTSQSLAVLENAKQALASQFESMVGEVAERKSSSSSEEPDEIYNLLSPLREQLNEFREKVEKAQLDSNSGVNKLESLIGALGGLNQQLAQEARNLSTALRGSSKAHGNWGEFVLRDLLEKAGLREGDQYSVQQSFRSTPDEEAEGSGSRQTDVIVHLPGGRHLIVDPKVSLTPFLDSVNADTEEERTAAAGEHLKTVRDHVLSAAQANYHGLPGIQAPDFVILFVPMEPALLEALKGDTELWSDAYAKGVLLAGPTTLLYVIRIVSILWRQEDQNRALKELTDHGATLHARFAEFVSDMDGLGDSLRHASARFDEAKKKLSDGRDSLAGRFEEFKQLSAEPGTSKPLQPYPFRWAAATEESALKVPLDSGNERFALAASTNGYHSERAHTLELEEAPFSAS